MNHFFSERLQVPDSVDEINEYLYSRGLTDGLPVIPPTEERVEAMIAGCGRDPGEVVAEELAPRRGIATIETLAINSVMAGCKPEYFPVVIAAVEAIGDGRFDLQNHNTTTNPNALMMVINGPVRHSIDINCSFGVFGPGWRANATIGRALRLILLNAAGAIPGEVSRSTQATPGRYGICIGEFEEQSPWEPLHVERGIAPGASTVTLFPAASTVSILDHLSKSGTELLKTLVNSMDMVGSLSMLLNSHESMLVLCPDHAAILAREFGSKANLKKLIAGNVKRPVSDFSKDYLERFERFGPSPVGKIHDGFVWLAPDPEKYLTVVVAGGDKGYHSTFIPAGMGGFSITKTIKLAV